MIGKESVGVLWSRGIPWFVEKRILDRLPAHGARLRFHMGDRGAFHLEIQPALPGTGVPLKIRSFPPSDPYVQAYRA